MRRIEWNPPQLWSALHSLSQGFGEHLGQLLLGARDAEFLTPEPLLPRLHSSGTLGWPWLGPLPVGSLWSPSLVHVAHRLQTLLVMELGLMSSNWPLHTLSEPGAAGTFINPWGKEEGPSDQARKWEGKLSGWSGRDCALLGPGAALRLVSSAPHPAGLSSLASLGVRKPRAEVRAPGAGGTRF